MGSRQPFKVHLYLQNILFTVGPTFGRRCDEEDEQEQVETNLALLTKGRQILIGIWQMETISPTYK